MRSLAFIHLVAFISPILTTSPTKQWKLCPGPEVETGDCVKAAADIAFSAIIKGVPSLGLPPFDPLVVDKSTLKDTGNGKGPLSVKMVLSNYTIAGFKSGRIEGIKFDCKKRVVSVNITMGDDVILRGRYVGSGKVLLLPVVGDGDFRINFKGYKLGVLMRISPNAGTDRLKLDSLSVSITVRGSRSHFDNLYNGNKLLGNSVNQVFNENWRALIDELTPSMNKDFSQFLSKYAKAIVEAIPASAFCIA